MSYGSKFYGSGIVGASRVGHPSNRQDVAMVAQHPNEIPVAHRASLDRAAEMVLKAKRSLIMLGAAADA